MVERLEDVKDAATLMPLLAGVAAMSDTPHVGFIGLGVMGSRMAATLARAGYPLDVFDVDPAKTRAVAEVGDAAARGVHHLDAPVSGGYREAENGTLVIIVGGERDAFERAKPVLETPEVCRQGVACRPGWMWTRCLAAPQPRYRPAPGRMIANHVNQRGGAHHGRSAGDRAGIARVDCRARGPRGAGPAGHDYHPPRHRWLAGGRMSTAAAYEYSPRISRRPS